MRLFLLVFFFIYGALHLHAFLRAKAAFDFGARTGIILVFFFIVMVLAPVIIRQSENAGFDLFALTSDTEQMPLSVMEAMAMGKLVVTVNNPVLDHALRVTRRAGGEPPGRIEDVLEGDADARLHVERRGVDRRARLA